MVAFPVWAILKFILYGRRRALCAVPYIRLWLGTKQRGLGMLLLVVVVVVVFGYKLGRRKVRRCAAGQQSGTVPLVVGREIEQPGMVASFR